MGWVASWVLALAVGIGGTLLAHRMTGEQAPPTCTVTVSDDIGVLETRLRDMTAEVSQLEFLMGQLHRSVTAMRADVARAAAASPAAAAPAGPAGEPTPAAAAAPAAQTPPVAPRTGGDRSASLERSGAAPPARRVRVVGNQPAPAVAANPATQPRGGAPALAYDDGDAPPPPAEPTRGPAPPPTEAPLVYDDGD